MVEPTALKMISNVSIIARLILRTTDMFYLLLFIPSSQLPEKVHAGYRGKKQSLFQIPGLSSSVFLRISIWTVSTGEGVEVVEQRHGG